TGTDGINGNSTIIPFATGTSTMALTTLLLGAVGIPSVVGFGSSVAGLTALGATLTLPILSNFAFIVPRAGTLTAISAYFNSNVALSLGTTLVHAEVYRATGNSNTYSATGVTVTLTFSGLTVGAIQTGTADTFSVPVNAGDRLLMVFSASAPLVGLIQGAASAGLTIN
ncbi:exosporium glycoprotein BclB-related protein, partial [Sporosarcina psychrophila]|uniref:exosporium glycoprotein BclB-related protein n=1 Tax=Sporosarcina psychrophila TaxID=1476 RepID=UPI003BA35558